MLVKLLAMALSLMMALALWSPVSAAGPEDSPDPSGGRRVGLMSTNISCVVVKAGAPDSLPVSVYLEWEGQIEEAFLVLAALGSEGGHSIYVNGQLVGSAPVRPDDQPCQAGSAAAISMPTDVIPIPAEVLAQGENVITLTNDANVNDGWTAANLYLEIHGILSGPPVASLGATPPAPPTLDVGAMAATSGMVLLTCTYEPAYQQGVWYQIPSSYTESISTPLLIGLHGMGTGTGEETRDFLAGEAEERGWLLAAPDMHGNYYKNTGQWALAWPGAQHDIIDAVVYMMAEYNVDTSRIYITGGSMGGQITTMTAAKYPDIFVAATAWKPLTDLAIWYDERVALGKSVDRIEDETGGTPSGVPFEYQRRSPMEIPQNSRLMPIKMWHDEDDLLVPIHHSQDLRHAINSWNPPTPVTLIEVASEDHDCLDDPYYQHCYQPDLDELFDYLEGFTLASQPPLSLTIRTDESKPYHWLNFSQTGGDHWSEVEATCSQADETVTATVSDTHPLSLGFNLGSTPMTGTAGVLQSGLGLPATTYLVKEGDNHKLENYTSGYLTTTLSTTGRFSLTISAIDIEVSADPAVVSSTGQTVTATITAVVKDQLNNPANDATVEFSTTQGTWLGGGATCTATVVGGQATATLILACTDDLAEIEASVGSVTGTTSVVMICQTNVVYLPIVVKQLE